jgi:cytochrome c oxidase subunit 3
MSLYRDVTDKPWNTVGLPDGIDPKPTFQVANEKVGLVVFVGVACVLFSLLIVSYYMRMILGGGDWVPVFTPLMLWVNTATLVLCSVVLQLAVWQSRRVDQISLASSTGVLFGLGGLLSIGFIVGQYAVWQLLSAQGYSLQSNPANAFFYLLTGVHVLHLLGGLWVWSRAQFRLITGISTESTRLSIELCAWYWHFLLLVWFGLFYVLAST